MSDRWESSDNGGEIRPINSTISTRIGSECSFLESGAHFNILSSTVDFRCEGSDK